MCDVNELAHVTAKPPIAAIVNGSRSAIYLSKTLRLSRPSTPWDTVNHLSMLISLPREHALLL